jgi:chromosome segregation ATPase
MEIALLLRSLDEEGHRIPGRAGELASLAALAFLMNRYDTQAELQQKLEVAAAEKRDLQKRFDLEKATKKELKQEYQSVLQDFRAQREKEQQLYESRLAEKIADKERFKSKVNDLIRKCEDSQANKAQLKVALEETRRRAELASSQAERVAQKLFQKKADKDRLKLKLNDLNRKFEDSQKALKQIGDRFEALQKEHEVAARRLEADVEKWRTLAQMSIVKRAYRRAKRLLGEHAPR